MCYLLGLSWFTIQFAVGRKYCFIKLQNNPLLAFLLVAQIILAFAFACTVLARASYFGDNPSCNGEAIIVFFFRRFPALQSGRILGIILLALMPPVSVLSAFLSINRKKFFRTGLLLVSRNFLNSGLRLLTNINYSEVLNAFVVIPTLALIYALLIANIEMYIRWNHFQQSDPVLWGFGQVRGHPLLLTRESLSLKLTRNTDSADVFICLTLD